MINNKHKGESEFIHFCKEQEANDQQYMWQGFTKSILDLLTAAQLELAKYHNQKLLFIKGIE